MMSTQREDQYWNAGATEIQQLNPGGSYQRHRAHTNLIESVYAGTFILSLSTDPARAFKQGSKVVNRDWVNH